MGAKEKENTCESKPEFQALPVALGSLGLTLAWYSLIKGWNLCASFSWDR